jgi:hypothetical protein
LQTYKHFVKIIQEFTKGLVINVFHAN